MITAISFLVGVVLGVIGTFVFALVVDLKDDGYES